MKKEIIIYTVLFILLAGGWHIEQWINHPIEHIINMPNGGAFGIPGIAHPFVFTFITYIILAIPRGIGKILSKQ